MKIYIARAFLGFRKGFTPDDVFLGWDFDKDNLVRVTREKFTDFDNVCIGEYIFSGVNKNMLGEFRFIRDVAFLNWDIKERVLNVAQV